MHLICPICSRELDVPEDFATRPFCSARCKKVDLHNWLNEKYRISEPVESLKADAELRPEDGSFVTPGDHGRPTK